MRTFLPAIILILALTGLVYYIMNGQQTSSSPNKEASPSANESTTSGTPQSEQIATIELERGGIIKIRLLASVAPKAAANFTNKANSEYYDQLTFHRVEPGFVVQGGDPLGTGQGGQNNLQAEYSNQMFKTGSVGMASLAGRATNVNDSQFFITTSDDSLSAQDYVLFGQVIEGMNFVTQIKVGDKIRRVRVQ